MAHLGELGEHMAVEGHPLVLVHLIFIMLHLQEIGIDGSCHLIKLDLLLLCCLAGQDGTFLLLSLEGGVIQELASFGCCAAVNGIIIFCIGALVGYLASCQWCLAFLWLQEVHPQDEPLLLGEEFWCLARLLSCQLDIVKT